MEYEAEFVEALNSYLPQTFIRSCIELAQAYSVELAAFQVRRLQTHLPQSRGQLAIVNHTLKNHVIKTRFNPDACARLVAPWNHNFVV